MQLLLLLTVYYETELIFYSAFIIEYILYNLYNHFDSKYMKRSLITPGRI